MNIDAINDVGENEVRERVKKEEKRREVAETNKLLKKRKSKNNLRRTKRPIGNV